MKRSDGVTEPVRRACPPCCLAGFLAETGASPTHRCSDTPINFENSKKYEVGRPLSPITYHLSPITCKVETKTTTVAKQPITDNRQPKTGKPKENLTQRAYLNSVTSLLDYGARTITVFVVTPFLVSGLGSTLFGVWQILQQFTGYTNLADIRATQVLKWSVSLESYIAK